jgi:phenylacetic acid degradation operon negative regulatory protein
VEDVLRRRSVGAPAARSTLLTILGEFLLPRPDGAWQEALIAALNRLGFTPSAARQAVVRSTREGWLEGERVGRRSRMRLTASAAGFPRDWPRRRAYELFRERHERWAPPAQRHFDELASD